MKAIFTGVPVLGGIAWYNPADRLKYLQTMEGIPLIVTYQEEVSLTEKQKMYNYFHGPLSAVGVDAYTDAGYEGYNDGDFEHDMKMRYAFKWIHSPVADPKKRPLSKADFTKTRLLKFIKDVILHLEMDFSVEVPDSEKYKQMKEDL